MMMTMMITRGPNKFALLVFGAICLLACAPPSTMVAEAAGYMDQQTYSTQGAIQKVRRERNLDHWDSDTLAYYLDQLDNESDDKLGYDATVMFYAQWDSNSHALAPYWDRIANIVEAGTSDSRLIMALFDCELNQAHAQLCEVIGITHYPTILFLGSGPYHDTDPFTKTIFGDKSAGVMGPAPIPNTVKFQGNWQYTDSILDWIRTMQALSNWHTWSTQGVGKRLRNLFLPSLAGGSKKKSLPIGVPTKGVSAPSLSSASGSATGMGSTGSSSDGMALQQLQQQVQELEEVTTQYEKMILRASDTILNLLTGDKKEDMFALLQKENAWDNPSKEPINEILRNCVAEVALDYCQRVSQQVANEMVEELMNEGKSVDELFAMPNLEEVILQRVETKEPYCAVLETCIVSEFADDACKPNQCPFVNPAACQYLTSCLEPSLQQEYAVALGLSSEDAPASSAETESETKGWGM